VDATAAQHPDWKRRAVVDHALDRVVGIDLNDYACALARARMVMTAAELAGVQSLAEAARFHPHVYWADGLEQVERDDVRMPVQLDLLGDGAGKEPPPRAVLTRPFVRAVLRPILRKKFQVVVGNPPYITERDPARKEYHREKVGKKRRYLTAHREYSLAAPFIERSIQLADTGGWIGLIVGNNFMKREFGKPLIEEVLPAVDLQLVVDSSKAFIPHHGTPTVVLFARNRAPEGATVRAVMGKRGEPGIPDEPAKGRVWSSIVAGFAAEQFENEFISVGEVGRETFRKHPWSLGGGGAAELRQTLERKLPQLDTLAASVGYGAISGEDNVFLQPSGVLGRMGVRNRRPLVSGEAVRDWSISSALETVWPNGDGGELLALAEIADVLAFFWSYKTSLRARKAFGRPIEERDIQWWEVREVYAERFQTPLSVGFAFVATHNHFVLDRGGKVFKQSAPLVKLPAGATEDEYLALLGLLNSSAACFWMKQVFHAKGNVGYGGSRKPSQKEGAQAESWEQYYEFDATKLKLFPIPSGHAAVVPWARELDRVATLRAHRSTESVLTQDGWSTAGSLRARLEGRRDADLADLKRMIALQEELDWECYRLYGVDSEAKGRPPEQTEGYLLPWRPAELELATRDGQASTGLERGEETIDTRTTWFRRHGWDAVLELPAEAPAQLRKLVQRRRERIRELPELELIEQPAYKRRWYRPDYDDEEQKALAVWLANRIECELSASGARPSSIAQLTTALESDPRVHAVAELLAGRKDYRLADLIVDAVLADAVPEHPFHVYKPTGLDKRAAWERTWDEQRKEDAGLPAKPEVPPKYGNGDFLKPDYFRLRGKLDVPKERFIAFTEVPGRSAGETLYGWAGWTPLERVKALLALDEQCEDQGIALADRIALLDSAWRLLPDIARDDAATAARFKAELAALVGTDGPSKVLLDAWKAKFPPPSGRGRAKKAPIKEPEDEEED
ncbi:MAG: BREX-2 system adenine-specific DNA-methyltransferase PglX, partial [Rhodoglobus sp.]